MQPSLPARRTGRAESLVLAAVFLVLTAVLALKLSSVRLLEIDEYLSFYSDRVATLADVFAVQLHSPISLDPPVYHLLSHLAMDIFGANATALRLPALCGFLLFQVSVFCFVRRIAGGRAALVALAFPLLTFSFSYAQQGRPYGLLLGLYAMSLACWQSAARSGPGARRTLALIALAVALALTVLSHYFGILVFLPIAIAELARTLHRRKLDLGMALAIAAGAASIALTLPFQKALRVYRVHYYSTTLDWHIIRQSYISLFLFQLPLPRLQHDTALVAIFLLTLALLAAVAFRIRHRPPGEPVHEWIALFAIALLPVFGYGLGKAVTHTMDPRYVIAALFAFTAGIGIVAERALRKSAVFYLTVALLFASALHLGLGYIQVHRDGGAGTLAAITLPPGLSAQFHQSPPEPIYTQSLDHFFLIATYEPDPEVRSHICLVYGQQQEIDWLGHDTNYITAVNLRQFAPLCTISYADFLAQPNPLILLDRGNWEWLEKDLRARGVPLEPIAPALAGDLLRARIHPDTHP